MEHHDHGDGLHEDLTRLASRRDALNLTVTDASDDYAPMAGAAVYLWHCDRAGRYSMYSSGVEDENYLRGIAKTDKDGTAIGV